MVVSCDGALHFRVTVAHWYSQPFSTAEVAIKNYFLLVCLEREKQPLTFNIDSVLCTYFYLNPDSNLFFTLFNMICAYSCH